MRAVQENNGGKSTLWSVKGTMENLNLGRHSVMKLAQDAGAIVRIGGRVMILHNKLEKYLYQMSE